MPLWGPPTTERTLPLAELLARVATLSDLAPLAAFLGCRGPWTELAPGPGHPRLAMAGRVADFTWFAAELDGVPPRAARHLARTLGSQGRYGGVLGLYRRERLIAIAAGSALLTLQLDQPSPEGVACLTALRQLPVDRWYADRVAQSLMGRTVGTAFFRDFRALLDRVAEACPSPASARDRREVALIQLTRLLFLYFIQSKGWLDGRHDFLRSELDRCLERRQGVHRHLMSPLFFGVLNRREAERNRAVHRFGRIPFLNGGLFERHPIERGLPLIPDSAWRDAVDDLFERYHFTTSEQAGEQHSIAPDMLGQVFEGVMAPAARKRAGTFYTPAALVRRLIDAGAAAVVGARLGISDAEARTRIDARDPGAVDALLAARILDPACGSGAFLLGALELLASFQAVRGASPATARRAVLRTNLYGVDLDPMAVRLAELRLWLAVVTFEPDGTDHRVAPLPNLDSLVRQGDSLAEPQLAGRVSGALARQLRRARRRLVHATGQAKRVVAGELRRLELAAAAESLSASRHHIEQRIGDLLGAARGPDLFGARLPLDAGGRRHLGALRRELHRVRQAHRLVVREGRVPWFSYAGHFGDIIGAGGFDLIVGNPPWVRAEALAPETRRLLQDRYHAWRGTRRRGFAHQPDLSVAFLERSLELLAPAGAVAMLVPAKLAAAGYAEPLRLLLTSRCVLHAAVPLVPTAGQTFRATVYPMALVATNRRPTMPARPRTTLEPGPPGNDRAAAGSGPWILGGRDLEVILHRLRALHPRFGDAFHCRLGVKTGADPVFLDPEDVEPELLRPAIRGRDIAAFAVRPCRQLLWCHDSRGVVLPTIPARAARWIAAHRGRLEARRDHDGGPPWRLFRVRGALDRYRLVWRDMARALTAAPLLGSARAVVPLNSCYVTSARDPRQLLAAAAWLNAPVISAMASACAADASGGYKRFHAGVVAALPWPDDAADDQVLATLARRALDGDGCLQAIDQRASQLLGLSRRDREVLGALA